jgi:rhodanese-related sulfurtransferase
MPLPTTSYTTVRQHLLTQQEIALLDVREEDPFAQEHPLFAANLPIGRIETDAWTRIPRLDTPVVVYDNGEGLAERAAKTLIRLGYSQVSLLEGGLAGWRQAGGELFRDVNVPSKSFGELVEAQRHTPSLSAQEVKALIDGQANIVVLDARRFDEYQTMSIPSGVSVPGAELVLRASTLAPDPNTHIVVNCAGRTRSIIGTQSLVNAGLPNKITALRNGTIGWLLAGQTLAHGASQRFTEVPENQRALASHRARQVADKAKVQRATLAQLPQWSAQTNRTTYWLDVRTPEEYLAGHLPGFRSAPGGQLVQETDHTAPVRGARLVLTDTDGVRANMSASWLAQMGWEVHVIDQVTETELTERGAAPIRRPAPEGEVNKVSALQLAQWLQETLPPTVVDLTPSAQFVKRHIPGAWFAVRSGLAQALSQTPSSTRYVLTCADGSASVYAAAEVTALTGQPVWVLDGGVQSWLDAGLPMAIGEDRLASPRNDRYRRPYEGTDAPREAMQGYLDWEFGLVEQLRRDGTHGFYVI